MEKAALVEEMELPPRARRIQPFSCGNKIGMGTTSACAENTEYFRGVNDILGNYLRVRGEYPVPNTPNRHRWELPPRARRIPFCKSSGRPNRGTTSACAENTLA